MTSSQCLRSMAMGLAVMAAPGWAQANGDTPRPPGADPSSRVNQIIGWQAAPIGSFGNPTGRLMDLPAVPPPANALMGRLEPGSNGAPGNPRSGGNTGGSAPSN